MRFLKYKKDFLYIALAIFILALVVVALNPAKAEGTATVNIFPSVGGSTDPTNGTYSYPDGTVVNLTATPDNGFVFQYFEISTSGSVSIDSDNPANVTVSDSNAYNVSAVFLPLNVQAVSAIPHASSSSIAVVIILPAVGGTTSPGPGTYDITNAQSLNIKATADTGWVFDNWVIGGYPLSHGGYSFTDTPTNNPYNINHGYGYTYSYQPVFSLESSSMSPTPSTPEFSSASIAVLATAAVAVLVAFSAYAYRKRK